MASKFACGHHVGASEYLLGDTAESLLDASYRLLIDLTLLLMVF